MPAPEDEVVTGEPPDALVVVGAPPAPPMPVVMMPPTPVVGPVGAPPEPPSSSKRLFSVSLPPHAERTASEVQRMAERLTGRSYIMSTKPPGIARRPPSGAIISLS